MSLRTLWLAIADVLAPHCCELCGVSHNVCGMTEEDTICQSCLDQCLPAPAPDILLNRLTSAVSADTVAVSYAMARFTLHDTLPISNLVYGLKYGGRRSIAKQCGRECAHLVLSMQRQYDMLIPVPLHPAKMRERGFNQAQELGHVMSIILKIPCRSDILFRTRNTLSQTRRSADERRTAMTEAFDVPAYKKSCLLSARVLLVDDVWTTGSTANACALALLYGGAKHVDVMTLCAA